MMLAPKGCISHSIDCLCEVIQSTPSFPDFVTPRDPNDHRTIYKRINPRIDCKESKDKQTTEAERPFIIIDLDWPNGLTKTKDSTGYCFSSNGSLCVYAEKNIETSHGENDEERLRFWDNLIGCMINEMGPESEKKGFEIQRIHSVVTGRSSIQDKSLGEYFMAEFRVDWGVDQ